MVTVVLLGWLGSKPKHLKRYVEFYNAKGIHAVMFVTFVKDVLSFDLGKKLEERIGVLTNELALWLSELDKDGRERCLMFHTFSNTGWLAYGAILENLKNRQDLLKKIKGYVVDSGADPNISPKQREKLDGAELIWNSVVMPRHKFILWLAVHGRLLTKDRRRRIGMQCENMA